MYLCGDLVHCQVKDLKIISVPPPSHWLFYAWMTLLDSYCSAISRPTVALCGLFFGFASRGGVVRATDGLCRPNCLPAVPHGERGAAFSTESPTLCRVLGLVGLGAEHEPTLHRKYRALHFLAPFFSQSKGLVLCSSRISCLVAEESFGGECLDVVIL